jgi:2-polyprenyl-3-methyl-5-hydroxy-6-metoxy-1,4-benzoquinol methylase
MADEDVTREHYDRLSATYEENWAYSPEFLDWMTGCILRRLRIATGEVVADIGCGTGLYARRLAPSAALVVCVEPSARMLAQVPADERLIPVAASAEDLVARRVVLPQADFDAILLKEVVHHVRNSGAMVSGLSRLLRPGGRMLVAMLPTQINYPLFAVALELFAERQPDPAAIAGQMTGAGLRTEVTYESFPLAFPTERYLQMVRNRYMSLLSYFDDAELDAGVAEIRRANPGPRIEFPDTFAFVLGTAP